MNALVRPFRSRLAAWKRPAAILSLSFAFTTLAAQAQSLGYEVPPEFSSRRWPTPLLSGQRYGKTLRLLPLLNGGPLIGDFSTVSVTEGFAKRFEVGYTSEVHAGGSYGATSALWNSGIDIVHGKAVLLPENSFGSKWIPSVAVGGNLPLQRSDWLAYQRSCGLAAGHEPAGTEDRQRRRLRGGQQDHYADQQKVPVLLTAGLRGTNASLWGLGGNAPASKARSSARRPSL